MDCLTARRTLFFPLLAIAQLTISGCSSQAVSLVHPQTGSTTKCAATGVGLGSAWVGGFIGDCIRQYQNKGYVSFDELTREQRDDLEKRGLLPRD